MDHVVVRARIFRARRAGCRLAKVSSSMTNLNEFEWICFRVCGLLVRRYGLRHARLHGCGWGCSWSVQVWYGKPGCPPTSEPAYGIFLDNSRRGYRLPSSKGSLSRFLPKRQKVWITPNSPHVFVPACLYKSAHDVVGQVSGSRSLDNDISSVGLRRVGYASTAVCPCPFLFCNRRGDSRPFVR